MDQPIKSPLDKIKTCILERQSFVLQGGAGSGKTETLKRSIQYCSEELPDYKIVCITHTNKAVAEIIDRVGTDYEVSTIHSFLNTLVKPYKRNLLTVLPELFCIPNFKRIDLESYKNNVKEQNKKEHVRYKEFHELLAKRRFIVLSEETEKVIGKPKYDKDPETYNAKLNAEIDEINTAIRNSLGKRNHRDVKYNETPSDSFKNATFGHSGLLKITSLLFSNYPKLGRIVRDKYDCIFIDEYQDTNEDIIRSLIYNTPDERSITIGLFGDSEQAIYEEGIGSAKAIIDDGQLKLIEKEDNFRCSPQVINISNMFRTDGLKQEVALKDSEKEKDREGAVKLIYALRPAKPVKPPKPKAPNKKSSNEEKQQYETEIEKQQEAYKLELDNYKADIYKKIETLTSHAQKEVGNHILLKLPNKYVARDAGFGTLYCLFDDRYISPRDEIKRHLNRLQFGQLCKILKLFKSSAENKKSLNKLILLLKEQGFIIRTRNDKKSIYDKLNNLLNPNKAAYEVMMDAMNDKIISISEPHQAYLQRKNSEIIRISKEKNLQAFKALIENGHNTKLKMQKNISKFEEFNISKEIIEDEFDERIRDIKIEKFYTKLFSKDLIFDEILSFFKYEEDDSDFMTMHKTKGTGIENVIVVLDEFNWNIYDFSSCFEEKNENPSRQALSRKLLYVACSRAKKTLICVRLANEHEVDNLKLYFENWEEIKL
ncbi:UvrD-helicase domain-containing protein [Shewanella sp. 0m-8]